MKNTSSHPVALRPRCNPPEAPREPLGSTRVPSHITPPEAPRDPSNSLGSSSNITLSYQTQVRLSLHRGGGGLLIRIPTYQTFHPPLGGGGGGGIERLSRSLAWQTFHLPLDRGMDVCRILKLGICSVYPLDRGMDGCRAL